MKWLAGIAGVGIVAIVVAATTIGEGQPPAPVSSTSSRAPITVSPAPSTQPPVTSTTPQVTTTTLQAFDGEGVAVPRRGGAELYSSPTGPVVTTIRRGVPLAATGWDGDLVTVFTPCDETAYVRASQVRLLSPAPGQRIGPGFDLGSATIVVDPGHGGPNIGAQAPDGTAEKDVNLDIANRLRELLEAPRSIGASGEVLAGTDIPAAGRVIVTRVGSGRRGDYEAGLTYRALLANMANASAMISVHNNAGADISLDTPGSDAYYQSDVPESRRLATLVVEELHAGLAGFDADWVGTSPVGAKSRLSLRDGNPQYYGLLRRTTVPTVIAEGAYIVNPTEAALLATPEFRQAYANALYRALIRFLESGDNGTAPSYDPEPWPGGAGSGDARADCSVPTE